MHFVIGGEPKPMWSIDILDSDHKAAIMLLDYAQNTMGLSILAENKISGGEGFDGDKFFLTPKGLRSWSQPPPRERGGGIDLPPVHGGKGGTS